MTKDATMPADTEALELRVIVFKDNDLWVAQCLEHDIGAQAADVDTLMTRLEVVLKAECKTSLEKGLKLLDGIEPAPARFFAMWDRRARSLEVTPAPWMIAGSARSMHLGLGLVA